MLPSNGSFNPDKQSSKRFALIGAAGYVAPRHMRAIKEVGGTLLAALDPFDSVGIIDSYHPEARFFSELDQLDYFLDRSKRNGEKVDYVSICSPNYLHSAHCHFVLRAGADAICEKPLVLRPDDIDDLEEMERLTGHRINTILQLRTHSVIKELRKNILLEPATKVYDVDLTYITSRGRWYFESWKGDERKSGGIATNIGVHFFDMLGFLFGEKKTNLVHHSATDRAAGYIEFERARVRWFLSLNSKDLPESCDRSTYRSVVIDGKEIEFSDGFTSLHTESFREILAGRGFGLSEVRPAIEIVSEIRNATSAPSHGEAHPLLALV